MLCHQVYPIPSTSTATGVSITVVVRQMGRKEPRSPTEQGRLPFPSKIAPTDWAISAIRESRSVWAAHWSRCLRRSPPGTPRSRAGGRARGFLFGPAALERRLGEGAEASYGFSYDQRVHFARAFIGIDSFGVSNEATDMVLEQDAVAAEQLARIADSLAAFHRGEGFRQRRMLVFHQSLVLQLAQPQHHRLAGGDVAEHAHEQVLDELETADRLAELNPLVRVAQRMLVGAHLAAHREPRHASARHPQDFPAVLERVGVLQAVRLGHAAILQRDEPVLHHAHRHFGLDLLYRKPGIILLDDEALDLTRGFISRPDDIYVGEGGVADPLLL